jgi:hypothetical protein
MGRDGRAPEACREGDRGDDAENGHRHAPEQPADLESEEEIGSELSLRQIGLQLLPPGQFAP